MFVVARIDAFSVSVCKCSVIDKLLSRRTDGRSKSNAKICGVTFTRRSSAFLGDRLYKSSAVAEMSDRGHNRHGPKTGGGCCAPFAGGSWVPV